MVAKFPGVADYTSANSNAVTFKITAVTPTVTVADAGGVFNWAPFYATPTVTGLAGSGDQLWKALPRRWSTTPGSTATGTPLSAALP